MVIDSQIDKILDDIKEDKISEEETDKKLE